MILLGPAAGSCPAGPPIPQNGNPLQSTGAFLPGVGRLLRRRPVERGAPHIIATACSPIASAPQDGTGAMGPQMCSRFLPPMAAATPGNLGSG